MIAVSNAVFRSTISCFRPEIFTIKSRSPKSCQNFDVFGPPNFLEEGPPNFWPNFINYSQHRTCGKVWRRSAQRPPRLGGEKSKRIETTAAFYNGRWPASWLAAIITLLKSCAVEHWCFSSYVQQMWGVVVDYVTVSSAVLLRMQQWKNVKISHHYHKCHECFITQSVYYLVFQCWCYFCQMVVVQCTA